MQDMVMQPGANRAAFGLGRSALQASNSVESLPGTEPKQPAKKINAFVLTRKLNSKIQAVAAKQTEIFVWTRKIAESKAEDLPLSPMILYCTCLTVQGFAWSEGRLYIYTYIYTYIHIYSYRKYTA